MHGCELVCMVVCMHVCMLAYCIIYMYTHAGPGMHAHGCIHFAFMHVCLRGRAHNYVICVHMYTFTYMSVCSSSFLCDGVSLICIMSSDSFLC